MKEQLTKKLHAYITENNPDLLIILHEENKEEEYLNHAIASVDILLGQLLKEERPTYIIEEICLDRLTRPLRPSKYNYIKAIVEEHYPKQYEAFSRCGILTTEIINLVMICLPLFEVFNFSEETEDDEHLRYVIKTAVKGYFNNEQIAAIKTQTIT